MKILFLVPYPLHEAPSQRFRFEQYIKLLSDKGHRIRFQTFLNSQSWHFFFKNGKTVYKFFYLMNGFAKRFFILFTLSRIDFVFIHRETTPIGPPIFEWLIAKVFHKKIIYDFDDAIWLTDRTDESKMFKLLKGRSKVASICKWSYKISCGNEYLCTYAKQFNQNVVYNPTTIDTTLLHNPVLFSKPAAHEIIIGWTGSHSTLKYLEEMEPVLKKLIEKHNKLKIIVIADRPPKISVPFFFLPWSKETEIIDLLKIDIGIMPLPDDEWSKGKCGFKALQYMALQIPTVASPIGVNAKIIDHGINGLLASTADDWTVMLERLLEDSELRKRVGKNGREKIIQHYSVASNASTFLSLFL